jgi:threonine dehydratase
VDSAISIERIREAVGVIDPVFLNSPQFDCEPLSARIGVATVLKVETVNPIRNFKGRGTDYLVHRLGAATQSIVCASAGNFGQGMAYACRKRGVPITVFAASNGNQLKIERMRELGATVQLAGDDFDQAKDAARQFAANHSHPFVEDGSLGAIGEGAGTMAVELTRSFELDAIFVPLGNGSLVNGIGTWIQNASPKTRVIAVCAEGAPSMALSWRQRKPVEAETSTIADGIAVRVPVPDAVEIMATTVDEVMLVPDDEMRTWMRHLFADAGLVVEPAGAAGVAAIARVAAEWKGSRVATVLTGGNLTDPQVRQWLY